MHKLFNQFECSNFIMPEHKNALKEYYHEREREEKHVPVYDQQEFDLWESLIRQSKSSGCKIKITTNDPAETFSGAVAELDPAGKALTLKTEYGHKRVSVDKINRVFI